MVALRSNQALHLQRKGVVEADEVAAEEGAGEGVDDGDEKQGLIFRFLVDALERVVHPDDFRQRKRGTDANDAQCHVDVHTDQFVS